MYLVSKTIKPYFNKHYNKPNRQNNHISACYRKNLNAKTELIKGDLKKAIDDAEEKCALIGNTTECVIAWEKVDEISKAFYKCVEEQIADTVDPLVQYCKEVPEADECRKYDV
jgi:CP12 domain